MRIYQMTATFGKLEHQTLTLKPGLNIITAPNEWGKSTWCAFLVAMLYGLDTRAKTTKNILADKDHYIPWSGSPMAGRIDLNWNGRDITIERSTRRRVPLGEFRAYETASGLPVSELTAANCGQLLLGVEQSVFCRAGFIRHVDLAVTQDEALRRRLNALVTTGDDSGAAERLADQLKELRNRCRYHRTGLLPQAEAEKTELSGKLGELETLESQTQNLKVRLEEIKNWILQLKNHQQAMAYTKMLEDTARVNQARKTLEETERELHTLESICAQLPQREEADRQVRDLRAYQDQWSGYQTDLEKAPREPEQPELGAPFAGMEVKDAYAMVRQDSKTYAMMAGTKGPVILVVMGIMGILAAAGLTYLMAYTFAAVAGLTGLVSLIWGIWETVSIKKKTRALVAKYGTSHYKHWAEPVSEHEQQMAVYQTALQSYRGITGELESRRAALQKKRQILCGDREPAVVMEEWQNALNQWDACLSTRREVQRARSQYETLKAMVRPVEKPAMPDNLTQSEAETARLLTECSGEQQRLLSRLGQYQGRMEVLGDKRQLQQQLKKVSGRIARLEETYAALTIAQETLAAARAELQRRFAPKITRRAQKLLARMTGGRYHSVFMDVDFSLQTGADQEDTVSDAYWRSDGTMDQLYLALRLAVAEVLTPDAPLVLDDALVRFDDDRMRAAVEILEEMAGDKQVILFTCQGREART